MRPSDEASSPSAGWKLLGMVIDRHGKQNEAFKRASRDFFRAHKTCGRDEIRRYMDQKSRNSQPRTLWNLLRSDITTPSHIYSPFVTDTTVNDPFYSFCAEHLVPVADGLCASDRHALHTSGTDATNDDSHHTSCLNPTHHCWTPTTKIRPNPTALKVDHYP